jgi:hypothetical protein
MDNDYALLQQGEWHLAKGKTIKSKDDQRLFCGNEGISSEVKVGKEATIR